MCLIKLQLLSYLGLHEEAIQLASQLISTYTEPAGLVVGDVNSMSAVKFEEYLQEGGLVHPAANRTFL